jgi:hypothetical protein
MLYACWQQHHGALEARGVFPAWRVRKMSLREVSNTEVQEPSVLWPQAQTTCPFRCIAKARNADLRDLYIHNSWDSGFRSYHYVFVDESGCDKRSGFRRMGWSPLGVTPIQIARFQREQRWQILLAYTQDGIYPRSRLPGVHRQYRLRGFRRVAPFFM